MPMTEWTRCAARLASPKSIHSGNVALARILKATDHPQRTAALKVAPRGMAGVHNGVRGNHQPVGLVRLSSWFEAINSSQAADLSDELRP
jgi:hypothetical protein